MQKQNNETSNTFYSNREKKQNTKELAFMCFFKTKNFLLKKQHEFIIIK